MYIENTLFYAHRISTYCPFLAQHKSIAVIIA